ncbi:hypothetical protein [Floccifex sp.]|uniref:hypothetical protein n=1 Tax=Floccifex sp. TaxID=2815810 RepID=UPI002A7658B6|nr:hypothetical protein [Floccifex sp.]MDD7280455.1 hypothetical protein [Erysipelotrichaceae bacterium]MDY2958827.1 hypothetical protein [Floccifex sp.]
MKKYYLGMKKDYKNLSFSTIGLVEQYYNSLSQNELKTPWFTIEDALKWAKDDGNLDVYLQQALQEQVLIELSEQDAKRLQKDPFHNCWLYEKSQRD